MRPKLFLVLKTAVLLVLGVLVLGSGQPRAELVLRVLLLEAKEAQANIGVHQRITIAGSTSYSAGELLLAAGTNGLLVNGENVGPWAEFAGGSFGLNGRSYRGSLLGVWQNGKLLLINRVGLEDYLKGVVPSEVPASFPFEVLKAQAVLARTYALSRLNPGGLYDLCADQRCQVYAGASAESPRHSQAVEATQGLIVSFGELPITAVYHADSGGYTAASEEVWGKALPYLVPRPDPYSQSPAGSWERVLEPAEVTRVLNSQGFDVGVVAGLEVLSYSESGRPTKLRVTGSAKMLEFAGPQATRLLRALGLPSTRVRFEGWRVFGQGSGHGVGMSQWGAKGFADQGRDFRQILGYYYPGTFLSSFEVVAGVKAKLLSVTPTLNPNRMLSEAAVVR